MIRRFSVIVMAVMTGFVICTCAPTKLANYQPKTSEEREVLDFLVQCDDALQYKKMVTYGNCFHENALIQVFGADEREVMLISKETFTELFLDRNKGPTSGQNIINPTISVRENYAEMHYLEAEGGHSADVMVSFKMIKEDKRWYIISYRWRDQPKKQNRQDEPNR